MKLSVIIPHYKIADSNKLLKRCVDSLDYDQLIIVANEGTGFGKAVNLGLEIADGDFIAIVNNDIFIEKGNLRQLCEERKITSPVWGMKGMTGIGVEFLPSCFVIPREIYQIAGGFDEQFNLGDYEDNDFYERCKNFGIEFKHNPKVWIFGEQGYTKSKMKIPTQENREKFFKKWKKYPEPLPETYYTS